MAAPIPYKVQSGETLQDISKKLGIKDWTELKKYHNQNAGSDQQTSDIPYAGFNLMTPTKEEIYEMNGETPPPDPVEEQKDAEQKQGNEKKKEEEQKKEEKASKSDHDGKYFVVHNAKCVCDKAENPKQTADLQVTTHKIIVLNDDSSKLAATEEDKTFIPPAATFGKCTLKPSSAGNLPCALAAAPKWSKTYESTQVMGKNTLTEISELQCMVGGKITIDKHGQTDSVSNAHADNTNPLELAMVNPAIAQPKKKEEYPAVTSISLIKIEDRKDFKEVDSKKKDIIYLRKNEEADFKANLKSGNKQLTSWMVYSDHQGKKENRLFLKEQIGTEFSQSFADLGKFRIEGYGKPKSPDFEKGKYDKCDPSCSIDVEVVENTLIDIECTSGDFSTRIDPSKNRKLRKGVPSVFKAKFFIPNLTAEEKSKLTLSVQDGSGNTITEGVQENGEILTFTPKNTKAKYTIIARFTNDKGEIIEKQTTGETEGNAVLGISHGAEVVRPGTAMSFNVSKMKYQFGADNSPYDLTSEESSEIKWNLNGILQGTGKSFTIAGSKLMAPGKYIVEAYSISANATGKNAKKEDDDWHFEVKENDVVNFTLSGTPKVGKPITATVDKMVFADLLPNETIHWQGFSNPVTGKSITFTPKTLGTLNITSKIKGKGVTQKVNVVEAKIIQGFWNDFGGSEISHAAWGQKVDFCVKGENIEGEEIEFAIYDSDNVSCDDLGYSNTENKLKITGKNDKTYASHRIELTKKIKDRTANDLSSEVKLYGKAKLLRFENSTLKDIAPLEKTSKYLTVNNEKIVYRAIIGEQNGRARHISVDYDIISWVYASTTYPKGTKLKIKIFEDINWVIDQECKELLTTGTVGEDGTLAAQINWSKLKDAKQNKKTKKYYVIIYDEKDNELLNGSSSDTLCNTTLIPKSILLKEASYTGAVIVGNENISEGGNNSECPNCKKPITLEEFNKIYPDVKTLFTLGKNNLGSVSIQQFLDSLNKTLIEFKIDTCIKKAFFLAQISKETGFFSRIDENLFYTSEKALHTFWRKESHPELYSNASKFFRNPEKLGNYVYRNLAENGPESSGDGYKYRGRGLIQITRKKGYKRFGEYSGKNLKLNPDLLLNDLDLMVRSAGWYWEHGVLLNDGSEKDINEIANSGDFTETTRLVHGSTKDVTERTTILNKIKPVLETDKCKTSSTNSGIETNSTADIEYHIMASSGEIDYKIHNEKREIAEYFYHDFAGNIHNIGKYSLRKIKNIYDDKYKDRIKGNDIYLVDIRTLKNYTSENTKFNLSINTNRYYMNDVTLAALLGALLECGFNDYTFNGFSNERGESIGGSKSHKNGMNGDLRYLRIDKSGGKVYLDLSSATGNPCGWKGMDENRQNKFNDALFKYGWKGMLSWKYNNKTLNHAKHHEDHNDHLHIQSFTPKLKKLK